MIFPLVQFSDIAFFALRLSIAAIFLYHSLPKIKNARGMAQMIGMPSAAIFLLGAGEFLASLGLIFGVYTQIAAFFFSAVMVGAIGMKAMKWGIPFAAKDKTGWEFDLILLAANIVIAVNGGGTL